MEDKTKEMVGGDRFKRVKWKTKEDRKNEGQDKEDEGGNHMCPPPFYESRQGTFLYDALGFI